MMAGERFRRALTIMCAATLGVAVACMVAWLNRFPDGMTFAGGDIVQYFDRSFVSRNFGSVWAHFLGEGHFSPSYTYRPYYACLFAVSDWLGLSPTGEASLYMGSFLTFSYLSAFFALLFADAAGEASVVDACLGAFMYAFNPYTFYAFYFIWGYSPFLTIYPVFPLIAVFTVRFFGAVTFAVASRFVPALYACFIPAGVAYGNLSFFVGMNLVLGVLVVAQWLMEGRPFPTLVGRGLLYGVIELIATGWAVVPQLPSFLSERNPLNTPESFSEWILWQRIPLWQVLTMNPEARREVQGAALMAAVGIAVGVVAILASRLPERRKVKSAMAPAWICVIAFILMIESKGLGLLPASVSVAMFSNPLLGALRSNGKVMIFAPFAILALIWVSTRDLPAGRRTLWLATALGLSAVSALPLFSGEMQTRYSVAFDHGETCDTAEYCYLNKIPPDYWSAAKAVAKDGGKGKILSLPYAVINSRNWTNYPLWKHVGADPTIQLFSRPVLQMNSWDPIGWSYGEWWVVNGAMDPDWIFHFSSDVGVEYFIFHKDVAGEFLYPAKNFLDAYVASGRLAPIFDSPVLSVYKVAPRFVRPRLESYSLDGSFRREGATLSDGHLQAVDVACGAAESRIVFRDQYSQLWRAVPMTSTSSPRWWNIFGTTGLPGSSHRRYARNGNEWLVRSEDLKSVCKGGASHARIVLDFWPQRYVYLLQWLCAAGLIAAVAAWLFIRTRRARAVLRVRASLPQADEDLVT
jgi:hypothetical protein